MGRILLDRIVGFFANAMLRDIILAAATLACAVLLVLAALRLFRRFDLALRRREVHAALLAAAGGVEGILAAPPPLDPGFLRQGRHRDHDPVLLLPARRVEVDHTGLRRLTGKPEPYFLIWTACVGRANPMPFFSNSPMSLRLISCCMSM